MGSEEFLIRMIKALGITIDRRPKGKPRKRGNQTIEKNRVSLYKLKISVF